MRSRQADQQIGAAKGSRSGEGVRLVRETFRTSRMMDFFTEKELVTQTGHSRSEWPLVIAKELIDNALDACEESGRPPVVDVVADATGISVRDNGPGIPETTLDGVMDFTVRVSSREAYVSPCRGAQGNALKTLLPMPWVLDPDHGKLVVTAHGNKYEIRCGAHPISQRPAITKSKCLHPREADKASFEAGTEVRLEWSLREGEDGGVAWPFGEWQPSPATFAHAIRSLVEGYALFNPHAAIRLDWFGDKTAREATDPGWEKWRPDQPTSPHWYELTHLERLLGACVTRDKQAGADRLASDFIANFDGLSGSEKRAKVLGQSGLKRVKLSELVVGDRLDGPRIRVLLQAMRRNTSVVTTKRLGIIGMEHLKARLLQAGVLPKSFRYSRRQSEAKAPIPWVLECAFGWLGHDAEDARRIYTGINWSSAIRNPFRSFGGTGEGLETELAKLRATRSEPILFALHLAHPRVSYTDRGKSALVIDA